MGTITLEETSVKTILYVPGLHGGIPSPDGEPLKGDLVWVGTDSKRLVLNFQMKTIFQILIQNSLLTFLET